MSIGVSNSQLGNVSQWQMSVGLDKKDQELLKTIYSGAVSSGDKTSHGRGYMGLGRTDNGNLASVKFMTHWYERGLLTDSKLMKGVAEAGNAGQEAFKASERLEIALRKLARKVGVEDDVARLIDDYRNLADYKDAQGGSKSLLSRKVAFQAANLINNAAVKISMDMKINVESVRANSSSGHSTKVKNNIFQSSAEKYTPEVKKSAPPEPSILKPEGAEDKYSPSFQNRQFKDYIDKVKNDNNVTFEDCEWFTDALEVLNTVATSCDKAEFGNSDLADVLKNAINAAGNTEEAQLCKRAFQEEVMKKLEEKLQDDKKPLTTKKIVFPTWSKHLQTADLPNVTPSNALTEVANKLRNGIQSMASRTYESEQPVVKPQSDDMPNDEWLKTLFEGEEPSDKLNAMKTGPEAAPRNQEKERVIKEWFDSRVNNKLLDAYERVFGVADGDAMVKLLVDLKMLIGTEEVSSRKMVRLALVYLKVRIPKNADQVLAPLTELIMEEMNNQELNASLNNLKESELDTEAEE